MQRKPKVLAGPFPTKAALLRNAVERGRFPWLSALRRGYHGWYLFDRNPATAHISKRMRRRYELP